MKSNLYRTLAAVGLMSALIPGAVFAQTEVPADLQQKQSQGTLKVELNGLETNGEACRATFVVSNGLEADLDATGLELVIFDAKGLVQLMTVFDFGALPQGKTVVRRFDLPETGCDDISRILINGAARCSGEGIDRETCQARIETGNKTETEFGI